MNVNVYGSKTRINKIYRDKDSAVWDLIEMADEIKATVGGVATNLFFRFEVDRQFMDFHDAKPEENYG